MKNKKSEIATFMESLKSSWFLIAFGAAVVYWAARADSNFDRVERNKVRIGAIEHRVAALESGIGQLQIRLDMIQNDLSIIKRAIIN